MLVKVCGLREQDNVEAVAALNPEWVGFIYVPLSPRYIQDADDPVDWLPGNIKTVGVFVNQSMELVIAIVRRSDLDMVQLHGNESPEYCRILQAQGIPVIKAFGINVQFDFSLLEPYKPYVEMFLFDTESATRGGTGRHFDWSLLAGRRFGKPFLLSGGIGLDDVAALKEFHHPDMIGVDVNSRFETSPGVKDVSKLESFIQQIH